MQDAQKGILGVCFLKLHSWVCEKVIESTFKCLAHFLVLGSTPYIALPLLSLSPKTVSWAPQSQD